MGTNVDRPRDRFSGPLDSGLQLPGNRFAAMGMWPETGFNIIHIPGLNPMA
jgi:hypothetical protein